VHSREESQLVSDNRIVQSLDRALALLETLGRCGGEVSVKELAGMIGINPATAYNLLQTLKARGYVVQSPTTKAYSLGLRIPQLAEAVDHAPRLCFCLTL
jgi:DNA-binding IclR family transcriptional regulator